MGLPLIRDKKQVDSDVKKRLMSLGDVLGWNKGDSGRRRVAKPSLYFIAERTGNKNLYDFLYHATSRSVHFSITEILRGVWGRPGDMSISSSHFANYWSAFSLSWGMKIYYY